MDIKLLDTSKLSGAQKKLAEITEQFLQKTGTDDLPVIVGLEGLDRPTGSVTLHFLPVDRIAEALTGFTAPENWDAVLTVDEGIQKYDLDVCLAYAITREGEEVSVLVSEHGSQVSTSSSGGRMVDCCKRIFGLETDPDDTDVVALIAVGWLSKILAEGGAKDWAEAVAMHSCFNEREHKDLEPGDFGWAIKLFCQKSGSWSAIRKAVSSGDIIEPGLTAEDAAWMDDNMYPRWVLSKYKSLEDLVEEMFQSDMDQDLAGMVAECVDAHFG